MTVDVFISYAHEDREKAGAIARALEKTGRSVWWDHKIPVGRSYDDVIEKVLDGVPCVVVLWSSAAVASKWVKAEARTGAERDVLLPVMVERTRPPLEFRSLEAAQLWDWNGRGEHAELLKLMDRVAELVSREPVRSSIELERSLRASPVVAGTRSLIWKTLIAAGAVVAVGIAVFAMRYKNPEATIKGEPAKASLAPAAGKEETVAAVPAVARAVAAPSPSQTPEPSQPKVENAVHVRAKAKASTTAPTRMVSFEPARSASVDPPVLLGDPQDIATSRSAAMDGVRASDAGDYRRAIDLLTRAEALHHAPSILSYLGHAQIASGQLVEGHETLQRVIHEVLMPSAPRAFVDAQTRARKELDSVTPRIPWLTIEVAGALEEAAVQVILDGRRMTSKAVGIPVAVNPGKHRIQASAGARAAEPAEVEMTEGQRKTVTLRLQASTSDNPY